MHIADIDYTFNGLQLRGHFAVDDAVAGQRPAVLVCHEGNGLSPHVKGVAEELARLGYVAFALDYYGGGEMLSPEEMATRFTELQGNTALIRGLGGAGLEVLLASEYVDPTRVAAIGYCFGGAMALELARGGTDLRAVIGFHASLATAAPEDAKNISGKVLVIIGSEDPFVPAEQRAAFGDEMRAGGVDWQLLLLGGQLHSFTNEAADPALNPAIRYDATAAARSWQAMRNLLDEAF